MGFERNLENNLFSLYYELKKHSYAHSNYKYFRIFDPKKRGIHKAEIKDRIVHQIIFDYLNARYEPLFIENSFSSRTQKGTHKAVNKLTEFTRIFENENYERCFALKCDIKKYFESIDQNVLLKILKKEVKDDAVFDLILKIVLSFNSADKIGKGIPLGNITSQIFANIYLNELDYFVKDKLDIKYYLRYNDDFIILDDNKNKLFENLKKIKDFISNILLLEMPDNKIKFRKLNWGIDFCGYIILPNGILLRQKTKRRMLKNIYKISAKLKNKEILENKFTKTLNSYFGLLKHCNSYNLKNKIKGINPVF